MPLKTAFDEIAALQEELQAKDKMIEQLKKLDNLTGLPNWPSTKAFLEAHLAKTQAPLGVLCVDFDRFKVFNHTFGYLAGDLLLSQFGDMVKSCIPEGKGLIGRLNGEAFLAVLPCTSPDQMERISRAIISVASELTVDFPHIPQVKANLTISIGGVWWDGREEMNSYALLRQSDLAMRRAKSRGPGQYVWIQSTPPSVTGNGQAEEMSIRLAMEFRGALERGEFEPYYQPLYCVQDSLPVTAEALVRWHHPDYGLLTPDKFLHFFEDSGLIVNLDLYMFESNCKNIRRWLDEGIHVIPIYCNFSRLHFLSDNFAENLREITERHRVSTRNLGIEITESILVKDTQLIIEQMQKLRSFGFSIAMDDFGSGYSSFGMLQDLPVDTLKLDSIFFRRNLKDFKNTSIICAIVAIAKALGMTVICEGIESEEQVAFLKSIGCDEAQGFYYARPMQISRFEDLLCWKRDVSVDSTLHCDSERVFIEKLFDAFFISRDFGKFQTYVHPLAEWQDVFCDTGLKGLSQIQDHFHSQIEGRKLSLIYRNITPHHADSFLPISGEAVLVDESIQPPYCRNFYFAVNCVRQDNSLILTKLHMDLIRAESYVNLFRAQKEIKRGQTCHLDEGPDLEPYYSMLPVGIVRYELTADMVITYMNQAMFDIIGYTKEQFWGEVGGNLRQIVYPEDLSLIYQNSLKMIEGENIPPFVYRFTRRDGSIAPVLYHQCTVAAADKRPLIQSMYISLEHLPPEE